MNIQDLARKRNEAAALLTLLGNPKRLQILCALVEGEKSVSQLEDVIDLSQSALSQHLARLRQAGVVSTRREAQCIYYKLADKRARRIMAVLADVFCKPRA